MGNSCSGCMTPTEETMMREEKAQPIITALSEDPGSMSDRFGDDDMTLLMLAARYDRFAICRWLLGRGHRLSDRDSHGRSALHIAVQYNSLYALREMMQYQFRNGSVRNLGVVLDMKCTDGKGILDMSTYRGTQQQRNGTGGDDANQTPSAHDMNSRQNGAAYRHTPSDSPLGGPTLGHGPNTIEEGSSDDESGVFSGGDVANEQDLEDVKYEDNAAGVVDDDGDGAARPDGYGGGGRGAVRPRSNRSTPTNGALPGGNSPPPGRRDSSRRVKDIMDGVEEVPDDAVDNGGGSAGSASNSPGQQLQQQQLLAGSISARSDVSERMNIAEPIVATGAPTLNYLLTVDHPPSTNPRHHQPALVHHFVKEVRKYVRRTADAGGSRSHPVLFLCATGRNLPELVPHSFLAPSMFLDRRIRLVELTSFITANNLDRTWHSIRPDVNLSFRAVFGIVEAPEPGGDGYAPRTPRSRKKRRQQLVHDTLLTPLLVAAYCGCIGVIKHLIILGGRSQIIVSDTCGNNVVHYAIDHFARTGSDRVLRFVLTHLKETEELIFKTNNNSHRPGEFNPTEADDLGIMSVTEEPLAAIPSMISFKHRSEATGNASPGPGLADVPSMLEHSANSLAESGNTNKGVLSPQGPPMRASTQVGDGTAAQRQEKSPQQQDRRTSHGDHHLAQDVKNAEGMIADVESGDDDDSGSNSSAGGSGPVDENGAPIRRSGRHSQLRPAAAAAAGSAESDPTPAPAAAETTGVNEETGEVTAAGSIRRNKNRRQQQGSQHQRDVPPPGTVPDANSDLDEDQGPPTGNVETAAGGDTAQPIFTPRNFGATEDTGGVSPAQPRARVPDLNVLPCLRLHPLRQLLHLD